MDRIRFTIKAIVAAQLLATGSLHAATQGVLTQQEHPMLVNDQEYPGLVNDQEFPMLVYMDDIAGQIPSSSDDVGLTSSSLGTRLLLSFSDPSSAVQIGLADLHCVGAEGSGDIELTAYGTSGEVVQHAKLFMDQVDREILVGRGSIYETKIDHGEIVLDGSSGRTACEAVVEARNLHISTAAPIRNLVLTPIAHDAAGPADNKTSHGVLLIDD